MIDEEKIKEAERIAKDAMKLARNTLVVNLRFMDNALCRFNLVPLDMGGLATDGENIIYDWRAVLTAYKNGKEVLPRAYLHMVMHCVFRHMFVGPAINREVWDLACDIAVEHAIDELVLPGVQTPSTARDQVISVLKPVLNQITAEKVYRYFLDKNYSSEQLQQLRTAFFADEHAVWYDPDMCGTGDGSGEDENEDGNQNSQGSVADDQDGEGEKQDGFCSTRAALEEMWKDISEQIQMDMETFSKERGDAAGAMMQELRAVNREKYDYAEFLRRFSVMGEVMQLDHDEFDYIFYTYGLKLYENMPLIEPLEYKEVKRIKEFVIAIDTSGSTSGDLVQRFLNKTYNILKQQENFFTKINLHIIQCDAEIQQDAKITTQEEFDNYISHMKILGLGGTDFRPVFDYVDELISEHEFTNLKGMIYFTDGCGVFPTKQPQYDAAFVFIDDEYNDYDVPVWAIKLVLQPDEI